VKVTAVNLETTYLGLTLAHPFMVGASPLTDHLDTVKRLEDGGSAAIVLPPDVPFTEGAREALIAHPDVAPASV
jgi:hypothetical protein